MYNDQILKIRRKSLRNNMPKPEQILWYFLRGKRLNGYKFRRQFSIGYYILDFYCPKLRLALEIDGDSHYSSDSIIYDQQRSDFLNSKNIHVLRFRNNQIFENIESVILEILKYLP